MSIITVKQSVASSKRTRARHSVMNNSGFGPVTIIQQGEKRLSLYELQCMTVAEANKLCESGLAISVA